MEREAALTAVLCLYFMDRAATALQDALFNFCSEIYYSLDTVFRLTAYPWTNHAGMIMMFSLREKVP